MQKPDDPIEQARAMMAQGDPKHAAELLGAALQAGRGGVLTRLALGRALIAAGDSEGALSVLRDAQSFAPGIADAALALGEALLAAGHLPTAIGEYQRAVRLEPTLVSAHYALGCAWLDAGEAERAIEILSAPVLSQSELAEAAAGKIAEAEAMRTAARAAPGFVRHLFDQFAPDYDRRMLDDLSYRAPLLLKDLARMTICAEPRSLAILDLGCGTGLAGTIFADLAHRLDGIDLSPRMIEKARARAIYNSLSVGDLEDLSASDGPRYDLILAADTLVYLGDLSRALASAAARLVPGGFFLFTVEKKPDGGGYECGPKRRYRHSEAYLREAAESAGFDVMGLLACSPRSEANVPVEGFAVALCVAVTGL